MLGAIAPLCKTSSVAGCVRWKRAGSRCFEGDFTEAGIGWADLRFDRDRQGVGRQAWRGPESRRGWKTRKRTSIPKFDSAPGRP